MSQPAHDVMEAPYEATEPQPYLALAGDDELVPEDDAVIGRALRHSLVVGLALAAAVAAAMAWLGRERAAPPTVSAAAMAPREVAAPVAIAPPPLPWSDQTVAAGIAFVHENGATGEKLLPEAMGGGVALFDYDRDDDDDLLLVSSNVWPWASAAERAAAGPSLALYRNDGGFRFTDVTAAAGLAGVRLYGMGAAVGDVDGDGWRDLYLTAVGENRLLRNDGGVFHDVTAAAGVGGAPGEWSTGAAFFDLEGDGDLDLFVCNYVRWSRQIDHEIDFRLDGVGRAFGPPQSYQGTFPYLFENRGDGTFRDVSAASGVEVTNPVSGVPEAKALAVLPVDVDGDRRVDLLVANDTVRNFLFRNRGDGTFAEEGELLGLAYDRNGNATGAMGIDHGDLRNDGGSAFAIGNFANEMTSLYASQGGPPEEPFFVDEAIGAGIGAPSRRMLTFGLLFVDLDLDGRLDLVQANGHIEDQIATVDPSQSYRQPAQVFWNAGDAGFLTVDPATTGALATPLVGRAVSAGDLDGDGDPDLVVTQAGGPPRVLRNDQATGHHWLRVRLGGAPDATLVGAEVEVLAGGARQVRRVMPTRGYLAQVPLAASFGLGTTDRVDEVRVRWPDGREQIVADVAVDSETVVRPEPG